VLGGYGARDVLDLFGMDGRAAGLDVPWPALVGLPA
jgi:hypothetical protein